MNAELDVRFTYKNWKGEVAERHVRPDQIFYGKNEFHPEPQWLLVGFDFDKKAVRTFAMKDISSWRPA